MTPDRTSFPVESRGFPWPLPRKFPRPLGVERAGDWRWTRRRLLKLGFTENQFGVLETLLYMGSLTSRALKAKLLTTGENITMILDDLETRRLVVRKPVAEDGRRLLVHLTPEGRRQIQRIFPGHLAAIMEELSVLSPAEQEALGRPCRRTVWAVLSRSWAVVSDRKKLRTPVPRLY